MSDEAKAVANAFYEPTDSRDIDSILDLYTEDARTRVLGEGPLAGGIQHGKPD